MNGVSVRSSVVSDVYALASRLRDGDRNEVEALGITPRDAIRRSFRDGILRKTYLIDGEIAAMSGLCGALLSDIGEPYLMTAPIAATRPVAFLKCARTAVAEMLTQRARLEGYVAARYHGACRLLEVLGFVLGEARPIGPKGELFRSFTRVRG